ncbi:MAG: CinA family nicotinamide mononucleotide deamidase-related protein [Deltaproteobacteria bacterium]|nr:CinA family nicotinamide mononucleotide deamidase-related protein [Deltaproteobacteria bacterium]
MSTVMASPDDPIYPSCEIITIGTELLLGQIVDTNTAYLAQTLADAGIHVRFKTSVGDRLDEMTAVMRGALDRCQLVVITGGLGPTLDDLTREAVARVAAVPLEFKENLMMEIQGTFRRYGYDMPANNRRQAFIPAGSVAISNPVGTAPAFIKEIDKKPVICLPGVPRELKYLMDHAVLPWIRDRFGLAGHTVSIRVLKVAGLGESGVDRLIGDLIRPGENPEVGLLASQGEIRIRIAAAAEGKRRAADLTEPIAAEIRSRLKRKVFGEGEDTLESVIGDLLAEKVKTLSIIETFSGGLAAQRLLMHSATGIKRSCVIPAEEQLAEFLGKPQINITESDALSAAEHVRAQAGAAVGLSILGFPRRRKTHYVLQGVSAVKGRGISKTFSWEMGGDPETLRIRGAVIGLNTLRLALLEA